MLKSLSIKNFAIIKSVEIDFSAGFNIITGETGSGKSIVIDALLLLLGERASVDVIRQDESKAVVEAVFDISKISEVKPILEDAGVEYFSELIIRREISARGSRNFLNDTPVQLNSLKQIGSFLIDFHGQHDNQILLNPIQHIELLDLFGDFAELKEKYNTEYRNLTSNINSLNNLVRKEKELKQNLKYVKIQLDEINKINPIENEDELIQNELKIIENSELLHNSTNEIYHILYGSDSSVFNSIANAQKILSNLKDVDSSFSTYYNEIKSAATIIKEISSYSKDYNNKIDFSPEKVEELRARAFQLNTLKKKYGTIDDIMKLKNSLQNELNSIENYDFEIETLNKNISEIKQNLIVIATQLSEIRKEKSVEMSNHICNLLTNLGINYPNFEVRFSRIIADSDNLKAVKMDNKLVEFGVNGIDEIEFYFSANQGEIARPLSQVASGGEISRLMLSMKTILATKTNFPTLVFDEIDTGISGRIAQKTGLAMKALSQSHQLISITHLPQIAALGDLNLVIEKKENEGKTYAIAKILNQEEKLNEIAKMLSGELITESSIDSARELINHN